MIPRRIPRREKPVAPVLPVEIAERGDCSKAENQTVNFTPDQGDNTAPAIRVCRRCPVAGDCLIWATNAVGVRGVYSGLIFPGKGHRRLRG